MPSVLGAIYLLINEFILLAELVDVSTTTLSVLRIRFDYRKETNRICPFAKTGNGSFQKSRIQPDMNPDNTSDLCKSTCMIDLQASTWQRKEIPETIDLLKIYLGERVKILIQCNPSSMTPRQWTIDNILDQFGIKIY